MKYAGNYLSLKALLVISFSLFVDFAPGQVIQYAPHVIVGEDENNAFVTTFFISNPSSTSGIDVTLSARTSQGEPFEILNERIARTNSFVSSMSRTIEPQGFIAPVVRQPNIELTHGWVQIESSGEINVEVQLEHQVFGPFKTENIINLTPVGTSSTWLVSGFIRTWGITGLAIVNPAVSDAAAVTIKLLGSDADPNERTIELPPGNKIARMLDELFRDLENFFGIVEVSSTVPVALAASQIRSEWVTLHPVQSR